MRSAYRSGLVVAVLLAAAGCGGGGRAKATPVPTPTALLPHAGDLDPSFGDGGVVTSDFGSFDDATAVAIQADGRIVAAGTTTSFETGFSIAVARYNVDGTPDVKFGGNGRITTESRGSAGASAIALASDGKIIVAGSTIKLGGSGSDWLLARYNAEGSLDAGFGTAGLVITSVGASVNGGSAVAVAIQPDGKIVAVGSADTDFAVVRYDTVGALDQSFGTGGIATTMVGVGVSSPVSAGALQADGKILVGGRSFARMEQVPVDDFAVVRYLSSGVLDTTFGSSGIVITDVTPDFDAVSALAVGAGGEIVAAGRVGGVGSFPPRGSLSSGLVRYGPDGILDERFGTKGLVVTTTGLSNWPSAVALQSDGKIIAAGTTLIDPGQRSTAFALTRYTPDGTPDATFGEAGTRTTKIGLASEIHGVSLQPDGKLVVAGLTRTESGYYFALARYFLDGN
jgi:uncharacterized delta-60 repeat protein